MATAEIPRVPCEEVPYRHAATLGPEPPSSIGTFVGDVFTTGAGWALIFVGVGVGFIFAVVVLSISVVQNGKVKLP